eukprot:g2428.t1
MLAPALVAAQSRFALDLGAVDPASPPSHAVIGFNSKTQQLQFRVREDGSTKGKSFLATTSSTRDGNHEDGSYDPHFTPWATASLLDNLDKTGWIELRMKTNAGAGVPSDLLMYAAGALEGVLSAARISQFFSNAMRTMMRTEKTAKALRNVMNMFFDANNLVQAKTNFLAGRDAPEPPDVYWKHVRYTYAQLRGMRDGYNLCAVAREVKELTMPEMFLLNSHGELGELLEAYSPERAVARRRWQAATAVSLLEEDVGVGVREERARGQRNAAVGAGSVGIDREQGKYAFLEDLIKQAAESSKSASSTEDARSDASAFLFPETNENASAASGATTAAVLADKFWERKLSRTGHCSALVRITQDNKDLLVGHTTWDDYAKMTRIFKYYDFPHLPKSFTAAQTVGMSSYPGCVSSTDEFYLLSSGLVVGDTSLEVLNAELYNRIPDTPKLPMFLHVMAANRMARTAAHWAGLLTEKNTGLKNAQWFAVDYKRFTPGKDVQNNLLWVVETVPGVSMKKDFSSRLMDADPDAAVGATGAPSEIDSSGQQSASKKYFVSVNRPVFTEIRRRTGMEAAENLYGPLYSTAQNPRAQIFADLVPQVQTLRDLRVVMRENRFPNEHFLGTGAATWNLSPAHAISSRLDLDVGLLSPNGGIDAKAVSYCLAKKMQMQVISGPTALDQKAFSWAASGGFPGWPHLGLPDKWDFKWRQMHLSEKEEKEQEGTLVDYVDSCPER